MINGKLLQKVLGDEYDIVGFDSRGTYTTPAGCARYTMPPGVAPTTPALLVFSDVSERAGILHFRTAYPIPFSPRTLAPSRLETCRRSARCTLRNMLATVVRDMFTITQAYGRDNLLYWAFRTA